MQSQIKVYFPLLKVAVLNFFRSIVSKENHNQNKSKYTATMHAVQFLINVFYK